MTILRALLLTDVVDSTKVTQELGDAAFAPLWAAHDRAARDLLPPWRGREIDKTDGLLLLFESVADAAAYALAYHSALAALGLPFKARAGLHWGPVTLRANSPADVALGAKPFELEGLAKPITARVMAIAQGGQTLLSGDAQSQLGPAGVRVQSHGHWRLKGLSEPVELFEAGDEHSPFTPPPDEDKAYRVVRQGDLWQPVREIKHSIPLERDTFVGRQETLLALARKFEDGARLVSVLGMGGTGKTRLVTRFALGWLGEFPGGVWFCDLSQARTVNGIYFAIAQGLDVPLGTTDPMVQLAHAVAGRGKCLVILDNFEQVARHAEATLGPLLDRAAQAKFIVTTREVLGIVGEETFALAPLPVDDAATLFLRRAESAKRGFSPGADDLAAIGQLVKVLDGLPLAIELAAARVRVMSPRTLLARMNERFKLLWSNAGRRDRQATLRAAFDWSWELLSPPEMAALAQLSVFEGGFTLASAEAVLDLSGQADAPWAVDVVQWLVDKSFVRQVSDERFDLLESVREYAAEHLRTEGRYAGSGPHAERAAQTRHCNYFAGLDERAAAANGSIEANNLVAACRRAVVHGDAACAVGAMAGAWAALRLCGPFQVALGLVEAVRTVPDLSSAQRTTIDWVAGDAHLMLGHLAQARGYIESGLARSRADGDKYQEARFTCLLGEALPTEGGGDEPARALTDALALARAIGDDTLQCRAMNGLGALCNESGQLKEARSHYESALAIANRLGDQRWQGGLIGNLATLLHSDGELDVARSMYEQGLSLARVTGDRRWEGNTRCNLGLLHHEQGRSSDARSEFERALAMAQAMGHARLECTVLCNLGIVVEAQGEQKQARERYEQAIALAIELDDRRSEGQFRGYLGLLLTRMGNASEGLRCLDLGEAMLVEASDQLSLALLLCSKAEAQHIAGLIDECARTTQRAESAAASLETAPNSELGRAIAALRDLIALPQI